MCVCVFPSSQNWGGEAKNVHIGAFGVRTFRNTYFAAELLWVSWKVCALRQCKWVGTGRNTVHTQSKSISARIQCTWHA